MVINNKIKHFSRQYKKAIAEILIRKIQNEIMQEYKFATGDAYESWVYEPGNSRIVSYDPGMYHMEFGRRPSEKMPPYQPLHDWLVKKFGYPEGPELERMIYHTRKSIQLNGMPATHIVQKLLLRLEAG